MSYVTVNMKNKFIILYIMAVESVRYTRKRESALEKLRQIDDDITGGWYGLRKTLTFVYQ